MLGYTSIMLLYILLHGFELHPRRGRKGSSLALLVLLYKCLTVVAQSGSDIFLQITTAACFTQELEGLQSL